MSYFVKAIKELRPGCIFTSFDDDYARLDWPEQPQTKPTQAEINAKMAELEAYAPKQTCKDEAKARIARSDWAVLADVGLQNHADFVAYRSALRTLIIAPVDNPTWPVEPQPIWT